MTVAKFVVDLTGSIATVAAVVVALWVALRDGRARDRERRDAEARQARRITLVESEMLGPRTFYASLANFSAEPITDVWLEHAEGPGLAAANMWTLNAPDEGLQDTEKVRSVLEPDGRWPLFVRFFSANSIMEINHTIVWLTYSFTDAAGIRWRKKHVGPPTRVMEVSFRGPFG